MNVFTITTMAALLGTLFFGKAHTAQTTTSPTTAPGGQSPQRQTPPRFGPSPEQQAKTQADHKQLLEQLKITSLRPGANGNPNAPGAAN
ncbi:MAG: hypothetical protein V4671_00455, partial [Armatimonadota bacterium]